MNKTALITGASKRIGKSISQHLAKQGWSIFIHYNASAGGAQKLTNELSKQFPKQKFVAVKANLFHINEVKSLISEVVSKYGKFNLLINNASVFNKGLFSETTSDLFDLHINVNFKAPFFLISEFAKNCQRGNVINFVDTRITTNRSDYAAYSLSKKALWELTKMTAFELSPAIRVNAIAPGVTLAPKEKDDSYLENLAQKIPMKRPGGVEPILKSIDYILSNGYVTGQLLFADGGENIGKITE